MNQLLGKFFNLQPTDYRRALLLQAYIFLIIFTLLVVKPTANSLFLTEFGVEGLPYAFILVAFLAAVVSTLYARWLRHSELSIIIRRTLWGCIGSLLMFGTMLTFEVFEQLTLYFFYLWVMIFGLLATSQFWVLANIIFNAREAKRLFGFIGAGAIAGGISGGYVASILASQMASENLLFVAAACLLLCFPILKRIYQTNEIETVTVPSEQPKINSHPFRLILESKHLSYLAGIVGVSVIVAKLIDYEFSGIAAARFTNKDELTAFFGIWFSTFNVISLVLQLFLTQRIMKSISVSRALYLMPIFILLSTFLLLAMPEILFAAIMLKMTDGSLKQSVNKAAMELMVLPIPMQIKNSAKTFIDVFIDSLATGISGILLIFIIKGMGLPYVAINVLIVALVLVWIGLIYKIRREYLHAFKLKINQVEALPIDIKEPGSLPISLKEKPSLRRLIRTIDNGTERQILTALQRLKRQRLPKAILSEQLKTLLRHPSEAVRAAVIERLRKTKDRNLVAQMEYLLEYDEVQVKIKALEFLLRSDSENRLENILFYLDHPNYKLHGTALIGLAAVTVDRADLRKEYRFNGRLFDWFNKIPVADTAAEKQFRILTFLRIIGNGKLEDYYGYIHQYLQSDQPKLVKQAIRSAGLTEKEVYLNILTAFLAHKAYRNVAQRALRRFEERAFPVFIEVIKNPETNVKIVQSLPRILRYSNAQEGTNLLLSLSTHENERVRTQALWALNRLRKRTPNLQFDNQKTLQAILRENDLYKETLTVIIQQKKQIFVEQKSDLPKLMDRYNARKNLVQLLEKQLDNNIERVFLLLSLQYSPDDILSVYRSLRINQQDLRANALEFLDNLLGINLKKIIIPIIESAMLEKITDEAIRDLKMELPSEMDVLNRLLRSKNDQLREASYELYHLITEQKGRLKRVA
ncbi:MAG: hypothetical protein AB8G22_10740 [Saprospiraceae bacterium]